MNDADRHVIETVLAHVPDAIKETYETDNRWAVTNERCILACGVAHEALSYFGIKSEPVAVQAIALNAPMMVLLDKHDGDADSITREEIDGSGAWSVATDTWNPSKEKRWPGHLILRIEDDVLADPDARQFNRPLKNMAVPDVLVAEPAHFPATIALPDGSYVSYNPIPNDDWRRSPDWRKRRDPPRSRITGLAIRRARAALDEAHDAAIV